LFPLGEALRPLNLSRRLVFFVAGSRVAWCGWL